MDAHETHEDPPGILLAFAVGLPWYFLMYKVHGEVFLDTFIGYHNITRFAARNIRARTVFSSSSPSSSPL